MNDPSVSEELSRFDDEFHPRAGRKPGIDSLPDGSYDLEIVEAELARTQEQRLAILRQGLRVLSGPHAGMVVENVYFLETQENRDFLGADLGTLGFDVHEWRAARGRGFSQELPRAVEAMRGRRFRGKKETNKKGYAALYVHARLNGTATPMPAATSGRETQVVRAADVATVPANWAADMDDEKIPF